jgi:hypothetical protein
MSNPSFTDAEWRRLVKSQNSLEEEEEAILLQQQMMLAKLARLRKQKRLLQKRASDFITRDFKEVAELEELERREVKERERLKKERLKSKQKDREAESARAANEVSRSAVSVDDRILAATSEDPTLTQLLNDPSFSWVDLDPSWLGEAAGSPSPVGGTVEPAGGSPPGSR